jgi:signal transduction histidine kinase/ligand-binding sensor domain-containing protein
MRTILFILLCLCSASRIQAQGNLLKYSYRHFGTENGMTQNSVSDAVFDKKGYLWISIRTDNVFVYDGYRFTPCWFYKNGKKFPFKSASLFCNSAGDIFISHENGIHVRKLNTETFVQVSESVISRENEETWFIGEANPKEIYSYKYKGIIYRIQASGDRYIVDSVLTNLSKEDVYFEKSVDGGAKKSFFWFKKNNDSCYYLFDFNKSKVEKKIAPLDGHLLTTCFAIDDTLYALDNNFVLYKSGKARWRPSGGADKFFSANNVVWLSTTYSNKNTGEIFINGGQHVYKFNHDFTSLPFEITNTSGKPILSKGGINKILQQNADYLWLFTTADGFYQLDIRPKKFEHFHTDQGRLNFVRSVFRDKKSGYVFSGLFYGGLVIYDASGKIVKNIPLPGISKDEQGSKFCVNGISKLSNNIYLVWCNAGRAYLLNSNNWSLESIINSGNLWKDNYNGAVIDYTGFLQMEGNKFVSGYKNCIYFFTASAQGIKIQDSIARPLFRPEAFYYADPWFYYGGIGCFYRYHTATKKIDSIPLPFTTKVKWISQDKYNRLWVSTETGIAILENGKPDNYRVVKTLTTENGLPNHYVYVAEPDNKGKMWCSSNKGIFSIDIDSYSVTSYSTVDGLQSEEFNTGAFSSDQSGNFYFGGINGLNFFNPESIKETGESNAVHISFIGSADSVFYQYPNKRLPFSVKLSYKKPSLLMRYSALNYKTQGFNQYEYKLHSSDSSWVDNGNNSELQLLLSPGTYNIQVRLKNLPLSATQLKVYVPPPFYQTIWFAILIIVAIAGAVAIVVNRHNKNKYRKRIASFETQQKIQAEKERIAKDLHDNLGVQANAILHNSTLLNDENADIKSVVTDLQETAKEMLLNLRETLWAMKTADVSATDLWLRIINFMKQMGRHYTNISFKVEGIAPTNFPIPSSQALHIVLVLQESVNNSVKHAASTTITATSNATPAGWKITLADDGKGFDPRDAKIKTDNYGLSNMQQRAIDGNFNYVIETAIGKGTITTLGISA